MIMGKKKIINNKDLLEHENNEDDYDSYSEFLKKHTENEKRKAASEIIEMGEDYLAEIEHKKYLKNQKKITLINYILKKTNKYPKKYLLDLDYDDVYDIYNNVKNENKPFIKKIIDFIQF